MTLSPIEKFFHDAALGSEDLAEQLKKFVNSKDHAQKTPLHKASRKGNLKMFKDLIHFGAEIEAKDKDGDTPLHYAAVDNVDVVKYLIDVGAQIDAKNNFGQTPLHCSVNVEVAKCLIQNGAIIWYKL